MSELANPADPAPSASQTRARTPEPAVEPRPVLRCPDCRTPLLARCGCVECPQCGWTRCG